MRRVWEVELLKREEISASLDGKREEINGSLDGKTAYILPIASSEVLGGVQPIQKTEEMNQQVGVDEKGRLWFAKPDVEGSTVIKPFPNNIIEKYHISGTDVFQLEDKVNYIWDMTLTGDSGVLVAIADDGTIKSIATLEQTLYYVQIEANLITIKTDNVWYMISTVDKTTAENIIVDIQYNKKYLDTTLNKEYIPIKDYDPTTKKYVDDAIRTVDVSDAVFITIEDIDEICNNIVESELPESDIDELLNMLKG